MEFRNPLKIRITWEKNLMGFFFQKFRDLNIRKPMKSPWKKNGDSLRCFGVLGSPSKKSHPKNPKETRDFSFWIFLRKNSKNPGIRGPIHKRFKTFLSWNHNILSINFTAIIKLVRPLLYLRKNFRIQLGFVYIIKVSWESGPEIESIVYARLADSMRI